RGSREKRPHSAARLIFWSLQLPCITRYTTPAPFGLLALKGNRLGHRNRPLGRLTTPRRVRSRLAFLPRGPRCFLPGPGLLPLSSSHQFPDVGLCAGVTLDTAETLEPFRPEQIPDPAVEAVIPPIFLYRTLSSSNQPIRFRLRLFGEALEERAAEGRILVD